MKIGQRSIKFIWGASQEIQARWRFGLIGFYEHVKGHPDSGPAVSVLGWLILALLVYVAGATDLFFGSTGERIITSPALTPFCCLSDWTKSA
jgi:hypothetical protein